MDSHSLWYQGRMYECGAGMLRVDYNSGAVRNLLSFCPTGQATLYFTPPGSSSIAPGSVK
jgi:hypothetical protein